MKITMLRPAVRSLALQNVAPRITTRFKASLASAKDLQIDQSKLADPQKPEPKEPRLPRSVQALYLQPLRRQAEYGVPTCDLQLRSYSLQPLQFFADFALRAAYYLGLPAYGPVPLPRITERWTVPRDHFIFKKSQENFERRTLRRLIQIRDGHPETMEIWLAYLRKHQFAGVGMKANMWEFSEVGVGKKMDITEQQMKELDGTFAHLAQSRSIGPAEKVEELLNSRKYKEEAGLRQVPSTDPPINPDLKVS